MNLVYLSWRNLWRNKRRTAITTASILSAVFFVILMRSQQLGVYRLMINNLIESYMGFLQIQHTGYLDEMSLENSFTYEPGLLAKLDSMPLTKAAVPRLESFALASSGLQTKGVAVIGIEPEREKYLSNPAIRLIRYKVTEEATRHAAGPLFPSWLTQLLKNLHESTYTDSTMLYKALNLNDQQIELYGKALAETLRFEGQMLVNADKGALISERLARYLKIIPGDSIILIGQGYQGASAAGIFPVKGIIKIPSPDLDNKLVYLSLESAQELYNMHGRLTSVAINLHKNTEKRLMAASNAITPLLHNNTTVKPWTEFNPVLHQQIQSDSQSGQLILGLLYLIVFFGIFGTVLMMVHERRREFGILIAIGMRRTKLFVITVTEILWMGMLGVLMGTLFSLPVLYIGSRFPFRMKGEMATIMENFGFEPIIPLAWIDVYILWQGLIVALMVILSSAYPLRWIFKFKETNALRV